MKASINQIFFCIVILEKLLSDRTKQIQLLLPEIKIYTKSPVFAVFLFFIAFCSSTVT